MVAYLTAGDPSPAHTVDLALALERGGADILELGVPFSDPIADGPIIQRASDRALRAGTDVRKVLDIASGIRAKTEMPIVLFSYLNPLIRYGLDDLCAEIAKRGVDGCLFTDLSVEEADEPVALVRKHGLDTVFLAAPTSTDRRLALAGQFSTGFVYVVSRTGVTGEQSQVKSNVEPLVNRLRKYTDKPLAVGFGVSKPEHVAEIGRYADGVVVGSAVMRTVEQHPEAADCQAALESLMSNFTGRKAVGR